jgi:3-hydroxyacyl-[acyl-carrier-protein] dehydratase
MTVQQEILDRIPHRPPFLWVDRIERVDETSIVTSTVIKPDLELFQGHYPQQPIMPGVLLCEAVFQSGALLMSYMAQPDDTIARKGLVPVLARIEGAKFKRMVYPGDTISVTVTHRETIANVSFLKGVLRVGGKVAVQVDFSCAFAPRPE